MSYGIGGYQLIDFQGIDLINEETLNTSVYEQIEKANKNKPLCIVNIVKDKIEYQAQFINVSVDNSNFTFYLLDRFIKVSPTKVESLPLVNRIESIGINSYNLNITNDFVSYNHTEILIFNCENKVFNFNITSSEDIKEPYNIIFTNPNGVYIYQVETTPTSSNEIDFHTFEYIYYDNGYYRSNFNINLYNLHQLVIKVIDRNIYINFLTNVAL